MGIFNDTLNLFGLKIQKVGDDLNKNNSGELAVPIDDDSSAIAVSASATLGLFVDIDGQIKNEVQSIIKYREISLFVEVDSAIQDILNEAIPMEQDSPPVTIDLDSLEQPDTVKDKIITEFDNVLNLLNYNRVAADMFRRWYVDGRIYLQVIVDKNNTSEGIKKLIPLDAAKIKKVKEVLKKRTPETGAEVIDRIDEYFIYNENGFGTTTNTGQGQNANTSQTSVNQGLKISPDAIVYVTSGYVDQQTGMALSYLHKAIRPINQLRMLEDATIIYFIARAPERRIFYIGVGNLPKMKAEQYLKDIMNRYRNKMVYDSKTGNISDDKKYMSMLEDFWMPRRDGDKTTEVTTLQGAQNVSGYLDALDWFKNKMYDALNVPKSRFQGEEGFNLGRSSEITRDELKFQKFVERLRTKFSEVILDTLSKQLSLKGIVNSAEWEEIKDDIKLVFQVDNYFSEFKEQDILTSRLQLLSQADQFIGKYLSYAWISKNVLKLTEEEEKLMQKELDAEKDNERAQPMWKAQMEAQLAMMPPPEGGDPNAPPGQPQQAPTQQAQQAAPGGEPEYDPKNYAKQ